MLLTANEFAAHAQRISALPKGHVSLDFETNGLSPYHGARAFIMGFTDETGADFCVYLDGLAPSLVKLFCSNPRLTYCAHGAQFEQKFLAVQFQCEIRGTVWDTEVMARLVKNNHIGYSLQKCAERIGLTKYKPMLDFLARKGNKLGYHLAPSDIIEPYVELDAHLSWHLKNLQTEQFVHWDISSTIPIKPVVNLELAITKTLFKMSHKGLLVDLNYCKEALKYEEENIEKAKLEFQELTGKVFVDSRKTLAPIFDQAGIGYGSTDKGNASFTDESLAASREHPLVKCLLSHRRAQKRAKSYWANFVDLATEDNLIHPSIHQNRAATGRMSISDPSAQNWATDDDEPKFPIRRAFVARPGCVIASLDYNSMELRLICDEAQDMGMIGMIKNGVDFHQQTADQAGVPRSLAKNARFAKIYGAGVKKIAETLGVSREIAQKVSDSIDTTAPRVADYSRELVAYAERFHEGYTFLGRRFFFDRGFEYLFQNYRIQGGGAEVLKKAILDVDAFLYRHASPKTFLLIPIHDEIVICLAKCDLPLLRSIKQIMIDAYKPRHLAMDVNVAIGPNFFDLEPYSC